MIVSIQVYNDILLHNYDHHDLAKYTSCHRLVVPANVRNISIR
jgi:hypothetical protein